MNTVLFANPKDFSTWAPARTGDGRSRHDYDCDDHLLSEMMSETYFGTILEELRPGDLIWITDTQKEQAVIRIDWIEKGARKVGFSVQERVTERPIVGTDGLAVKYRGPRGGLWCIIDAGGEILSKDHRTREEAERARDIVKARAA